MKTTLQVEGMSCEHCEAAVKGALEELNGVSSVDVSLDSGEVEVTYDDAKVSVEDMEKAVEDQGYDIVH